MGGRAGALGASHVCGAGAGLTGDTARHKGKANGREVHSIDQAWAASGGPSVQNLTIDLAEHRPDDQVWLPSSQAARRSVVRWVFQVGYREFKASLSDGKGKGRAAGAALSRCRVLGNVILGASLADACSVSGFSTVKAWVESCKDAGLFESLRASRVAGLADCQAVELHRVASRHWALQVNRLARALASVGGVAWADTMATDSQRAQGRRGKAAGARTLRRRAIVRDLARALDLATWHKAKARAAAADTLALFDHALDGIHSDKWGDLRVLAGLSDKLGRAVGGSKIDGAAIGKARGKVAHKAPTVGRAESIGRRASKRPCAVSVGGAGVYGMDGPAGFVLSIGRDPAASLAPWSGAFRLALVRALASARS